MSDLDSDGLDSEIEKAWDIGCASIIPEKSRCRYENVYKIFNISFLKSFLLFFFTYRSRTVSRLLTDVLTLVTGKQSLLIRQQTR